MKIQLSKIVFLLFIVVSACNENGSNGNNPPSLTYLGMDRDTMVQGISGDSVVVFLQFEDVDGDLSSENNARNISVIDNRDGVIDPISLPILPEQSQGQRGEMKITILTTCCIYPVGVGAPCEANEEFPSNQFSYDIFIKDDNGNQSNRVTTDLITLLCR